VTTAAFFSSHCKKVIIVHPAMIIGMDGANKNDYECNDSHRFYENFAREHSHLKVIAVESELTSNTLLSLNEPIKFDPATLCS
jgi:hypothetical protein